MVAYSSIDRAKHRFEITTVLAKILKKGKTERGDCAAIPGETAPACTNAALLVSSRSFLFVSLDSCLLPLSLFLSSPVASTLTFCTTERRIGSLNKMTRLFIDAFVRVKVGTPLFFSAGVRESLCEHFGWSALGNRRCG